MIKPNFSTEKSDVTGKSGKFIISPLPAGYGQTIGNALRRILYSSIPGVAATYVKIAGVSHPFATITGVKESILEIILNIKQLRFEVAGDGPFKMTYSAKSTGEVKGGDFVGGDIQVINKDCHIAQVTGSKVKLDIEITVETGYGYSPAEDRDKDEFARLPIDATFSPITKVNYLVEGMRVGRKSDFDKLTVEIITDGSISPEEALKNSAATAADFFGHILSGRDVKKTESEVLADESKLPKEVDQKVYQTIIDELDLPTRVINALLREKIETVEDLVKRGREDLVNLKGVGRKSVDLIEKELIKLGVPFDDDTQS